MKICKGCKQDLSLREFYKCTRMRDGYHNYCVKCTSERGKERRRLNADDIREKNKTKYQLNKEEILFHHKIYYKKHAKELKVYQAAYRKKNPDKVKACKVFWGRKNAIKHKTTRVRWHAEHPGKHTEYSKRWCERNQVKRLCHLVAWKDLRSGSIKKTGCIVCKKLHNIDNTAQMHHCNYSKPLEVMWLCHKHHHGWHRVFKSEETNASR